MWRIIIAICSILLGTTEARPKYTPSSRSYTKTTTYSPSTYYGYRGGYVGGSYTNVYIGGGGYYYVPAYYGYHSTVVVGGGGGAGGLCCLLCFIIFFVILISASGNCEGDR